MTRLTYLYFSWILLVLLLSVSVACRRHPSDEVFVTRFLANEAKFYELVKMFEEDKTFMTITVRIVTGANRIWVEPSTMQDIEAAGLPLERYRRYLQLYKELGIELGLIRSEGGAGISLVVSESMYDNSTKGYYYSLVAPTPLVSDLDHIVRPEGLQGYAAYKPLKGNWYLMYGNYGQ